ncbi:MAG: winged helix-turn-helix transcriptional regulator [Cyclobacteriaceae bacterium]|nr:winged helix-turn-helix transcriptional regulator [Cyclobacteriaceae bacterium]
MGASKSDVFNARQNKIASYAKALAHPARIAIIQMLISRQACICNELVDELPLSQSTISQHLKELKTAGLIKGEIERPRINYCIDREAWAEAQQLLQDLFAAKPNVQCC